MRFELTTTDLEGRGTSSCATEMSKMIPNLPIFHWRKTLPRSGLADIYEKMSCIKTISLLKYVGDSCETLPV